MIPRCFTDFADCDWWRQEVPEAVGVAGDLPGAGECVGVRWQAGTRGRTDEGTDDALLPLYVAARRHRPVRQGQHHRRLQERQCQTTGGDVCCSPRTGRQAPYPGGQLRLSQPLRGLRPPMWVRTKLKADLVEILSLSFSLCKNESDKKCKEYMPVKVKLNYPVICEIYLLWWEWFHNTRLSFGRRTGRAGNKGFAFTFITPEQERYAGDIIKALELSGASVNSDLEKLWNDYKERAKAVSW